jgi:hypothetical protein
MELLDRSSTNRCIGESLSRGQIVPLDEEMAKQLEILADETALWYSSRYD